MVDEIANSIPAPVASTETPSVEATPSPVVPETPITEAPAVTEPVVETAPEPEKIGAPLEAAKPETLLGGEKKSEEAASPEVKEEPTVVPPKTDAPLPVYEPFTLPEGFIADEAKMGELTSALAEFETKTKASHEEVHALGQKMVEKYIDGMQRYTESLTQAWNKQKNDWKDAFLKDPEFANRTDTVVNSAIDAISVYGGDAKQQEEFRGLMESTGIGNHPAMIRMLSNIMLAKAEPKQLAAPQIASIGRTSKVQKMYGQKKA